MQDKNKHSEGAVALLGAVELSGTKIPMYSSRPQAGFPAPGDDSIENVLDINDLVVAHPAATFFVRVEGDSMDGAGIFSGDVLVVDRSISPKDGSIVVAAVYGEMVVKRLRATGETHILVSENEGYSPIHINDNDECFIWGVVVGSVRQFV
jgi:DNA polymerase V